MDFADRPQGPAGEIAGRINRRFEIGALYQKAENSFYEAAESACQEDGDAAVEAASSGYEYLMEALTGHQGLVDSTGGAGHGEARAMIRAALTLLQECEDERAGRLLIEAGAILAQQQGAEHPIGSANFRCFRSHLRWWSFNHDAETEESKQW